MVGIQRVDLEKGGSEEVVKLKIGAPVTQFYFPSV